MKLFTTVFIFLLLVNTTSKAEEVDEWLKNEIEDILSAYRNDSISNIDRFNLIEITINNNFAGAGIGKFVAGKSWLDASKETKKEYIKLFKKHLALSIASIMQGYSDQEYQLININHDKKNNITLIDMKIINDTGNFLVTWRVKKSKNRFFVIDLIVADISLVVTKRSEFNSMLKKVKNDLYSFNKILRQQNESSYAKITN